jgi:hypothetical protein
VRRALPLVLVAALWPAGLAGASAPQDGHWKGRLAGGEKAAKVKFKVAGGGRVLKDFSTTVAAFCVGPSIGTNYTAILVVSVPKAKVKPNGRFKRTYKTDGGGTYKISGTLRGRKVRDGRVDVNVSTCGGHDQWTARRASR